MRLMQISQYIHLQDDPMIWGADMNQFREVLNTVAIEFHKLSLNFTKYSVIVLAGNNNPMCCPPPEFNIILLSARGNHWSQYTYQFAHEYCHHIVAGPLDGELKDSFWFEEAICELASIYMLRYIGGNNIYTNPLLRLFTKSHLSYANDIIDRESNKIHTSLSNWIKDNLGTLQNPKYEREMYTTIAVNILDLYEEDPKLWGVLPYLRRDNGYEYKNFYNYLNEVEARIPSDLKPLFVKLKQRLTN